MFCIFISTWFINTANIIDEMMFFVCIFHIKIAFNGIRSLYIKIFIGYLLWIKHSLECYLKKMVLVDLWLHVCMKKKKKPRNISHVLFYSLPFQKMTNMKKVIFVIFLRKQVSFQWITIIFFLRDSIKFAKPSRAHFWK